MTSNDSRRLWAWTLSAATAAGLAAWLIGETKPMWVEAEKRVMMTMGTPGTVATSQTLQAAEVATAARLHGVFGGCLGLALGIAGGLASGSPRRGIRIGLLGMVCGAVVGFGASYAVVPIFYRVRDSFSIDLIPSFLMHGVIWGCLSATAAIALAVGLGGGTSRFGRAVSGGLLGALFGAIIFEMSGAVCFANDDTGWPVSKSAASRLMARLLIAVSVAIGASVALEVRRSSRLIETPDPS